VSVCVCVRERERERESVCVCVRACEYATDRTCADERKGRPQSERGRVGYRAHASEVPHSVRRTREELDPLCPSPNVNVTNLRVEVGTDGPPDVEVVEKTLARVDTVSATPHGASSIPVMREQKEKETMTTDTRVGGRHARQSWHQYWQ
jgi:hypothetical protein